MKAFALILIIQLLVSGCASIINGTTETIHIRSYEPGTKFFLGEKEIGTDHIKISIPKKKLKQSVLFARKEGCRDKQEKIQTRFDSLSLFGLFIDMGIISILAVDWGYYGSIKRADKANYVLTPEC